MATEKLQHLHLGFPVCFHYAIHATTRLDFLQKVPFRHKEVCRKTIRLALALFKLFRIQLSCIPTWLNGFLGEILCTCLHENSDRV